MPPPPLLAPATPSSPRISEKGPMGPSVPKVLVSLCFWWRRGQGFFKGGPHSPKPEVAGVWPALRGCHPRGPRRAAGRQLPKAGRPRSPPGHCGGARASPAPARAADRAGLVGARGVACGGRGLRRAGWPRGAGGQGGAQTGPGAPAARALGGRGDSILLRLLSFFSSPPLLSFLSPSPPSFPALSHPHPPPCSFSRGP